MDIDVIPHGLHGCAVVSVTGEVDLFTAPQLRARLADLVAAGELHLVVDLHQVEFIDSAGLGALVDGIKRTRAAGGSLQLVCTQRWMLSMFDVMGLARVVPVHAQLEAAAALCGAEG